MFLKGFAGRDFEKKRAGVRVKSITGRNAQLAWILLDPGQVTDHVHDHEQIGYILSGQLRITIGDTVEDLSRGDGFCIPAQVRHGVRVLGDTPAEYFEIFSPPKDENIL